MSDENARYESPAGQQNQLISTAITAAREAYLRGEITAEYAADYATVISKLLPNLPANTPGKILAIITAPEQEAEPEQAYDEFGDERSWDWRFPGDDIPAEEPGTPDTLQELREPC